MITTNRNMFLGAHVTTEVKQALKTESKAQKMSVSMLVYVMLARALQIPVNVKGG